MLRLDEPLRDLDVAGLALAQPRPRESCYIYGAISGYQGTGQTVYAQLAAQPGVDGRHQLNAPPGGEHGYKIRRGFSGSPIFDELGNTIWGMVVTVETDPETYVAFCTPADALRQALRAAQIEPPAARSNQAFVPKAAEELARDALAALRRVYEQRLSEQRDAYERQIQELRQAVNKIAEAAREPANEEPVAFALRRLKQGDPEPAEELLGRLLDAAPERTPEERSERPNWPKASGCLHISTTLIGRSEHTKWRPDSTRTTSGHGSIWADCTGASAI